MGRETTNRVLPEEDKLLLLQLIEQIGQVAEGLEKLQGTDKDIPRPPSSESVFRSEESTLGLLGIPIVEPERRTRSSRPPLPEPRLVRQIISQRRHRDRFFDHPIFADPAWDMLLDLTAARAEHVRVSVTSLCIASGVPQATALRWIGQLIDAGLFQRIEDDVDRRRTFIELTDKAAGAISRYFASLGNSASVQV
ncbi:MAG: winged helix DNA-binding protein [Novosphingobium sp.]|nr:winged helix DNA-binding protein [Novosphingobium sp.]